MDPFDPWVQFDPLNLSHRFGPWDQFGPSRPSHRFVQSTRLHQLDRWDPSHPWNRLRQWNLSNLSNLSNQSLRLDPISR